MLLWVATEHSTLTVVVLNQKDVLTSQVPFRRKEIVSFFLPECGLLQAVHRFFLSFPVNRSEYVAAVITLFSVMEIQSLFWFSVVRSKKIVSAEGWRGLQTSLVSSKQQGLQRPRGDAWHLPEDDISACVLKEWVVNVYRSGSGAANSESFQDVWFTF